VKKWVRPIVGFAVTALFVWLLTLQVDARLLRVAFARLSPAYALLGVTFLAAGYFLRIVRWWRLLRVLDSEVRVSACVWPFLVSVAANNLLPFRAGDALRVVGFRRELRAPAMRVLGTLVIERLLDLTMLLAIFFTALLGVPAGVVPEAFVRVAALLAGVTAAALIGLVLFAGHARQLAGWILARPVVPSEAAARLAPHLDNLLGTLGMLKSPLLSLQLLGLSAAVWAFEGLVFVTVAAALHVGGAATAPWFALALGTLATLLPSSPGYVGTFDYFAVLGLTAYGADRETATAFAVVVHLVLWLPLTLAGLTYFLQPGARLIGLRAARPEVSEELS
jgi:uncharacterized protein (TIRG00374 family)